MIGILIKYNEKIMFAGLPKDNDSLKNQLSRIGLDISPHEIALTSNNDYDYEIEIYGCELTSRIRNMKKGVKSLKNA